MGVEGVCVFERLIRYWCCISFHLAQLRSAADSDGAEAERTFQDLITRAQGEIRLVDKSTIFDILVFDGVAVVCIKCIN